MAVTEHQGTNSALTANDFPENQSKIAKADRGIVVDFLEPPGSEKPVKDTGGVGIYVSPYKYI